ncbi:cell division regulator GpsB [Lysinibacillus sp. KU-BSD001]|uniref:cell division regulator GpsB n=1 Tax=Lysinibacillus sp. KU-BSD001 TaxID=3141328 RepID=UPI0036E55695
MEGRCELDIKLTSKDILEKEFKKSVKGYNIDQVDQFLDQIMEDYDNFEQVINELKAENERLKGELSGSVRKPAPQPTTSNMNYDILKRVANLEKAVFGDKLKEKL